MSSVIDKLKSVLKKFFKEYGIAFIIFLPFVLYGYIKYNQLKDNIEYTQAVILDDFRQIRRTSYFSYEFFVKGVKYTGSGEYNPKTDTIQAGDSVKIVYDRTDPSNNETLKIFNKGWFY